MSFTFLLCSPLWLPLYCSLHVFSCAPPLRYHTWPPPSSLSPHLFIVCVLSLCFPLKTKTTLSINPQLFAAKKLCRVVSCHCPSRLSLSMGLRGVVAGANPSLGEGRVLPQGHFDMQHAAQHCPEQGFEPATFRSLVDLLYPLSYNCPMVKGYQKFTAVLYEMLYC